MCFLTCSRGQFATGPYQKDKNRYDKRDVQRETWHTGRDTYDKVVFDDLEKNATLTAMLAYLASEDPTMISRDRADLAKIAAEMQARMAASSTSNARAGRGFRFPTTWPECEPAPRSTKPRLK